MNNGWYRYLGAGIDGVRPMAQRDAEQITHSGVTTARRCS